MRTDEERLKALRASMSPSQREEMSEIIQMEMERRGLSGDAPAPKQRRAQKSGSGLDSEQLREIYADVSRRESERQGVNRGRRKLFGGGIQAQTIAKIGLVTILGTLGGVKIFGMPAMSLPAVFEEESPLPPINPEEEAERAERRAALRRDLEAAARGERREMPGSVSSAVTPAVVHGDLDGRRVELEKRKEILDRREEELRTQEQALNERLAELRALTQQLGETRAGEEEKKTARMDQLAAVYSAMSPNEAADLLSRIEPAIALHLLERMPEKRMGQILGLMDHERAIELTRELSH